MSSCNCCCSSVHLQTSFQQVSTGLSPFSSNFIRGMITRKSVQNVIFQRKIAAVLQVIINRHQPILSISQFRNIYRQSFQVSITFCPLHFVMTLWLMPVRSSFVYCWTFYNVVLCFMQITGKACGVLPTGHRKNP